MTKRITTSSTGLITQIEEILGAEKLNFAGWHRRFPCDSEHSEYNPRGGIPIAGQEC